MKKVLFGLISLGLCAMLLVGCNGTTKSVDDTTTTTIYVAKDGKITSIIVEDFSEKYYDQAEMTAMINSEIADFNSAHGADSVVLNSVSVDNMIAKVSITYENCDVYSEFNKEELYVSTVKEALNTGKTLNVTLKNPLDENNTIGMTEIAGMDSEFIVISSEEVDIRCAGKILYVSQETTYVDEYEINAYENQDDTYVIFK